MPTRCTEAATCSGIRNSWSGRTRAGKPDKPDHTSGPPLALLRSSRSSKSPRPECASEPPWGYARRLHPSLPVRCFNDARPFLSNSVLKPFGARGSVPSSLVLHCGHGAPAPPQSQARSPWNGRSGCASHTQPQSSQTAHFIRLSSASAGPVVVCDLD
jgi:hypothetical protein